MALLGDASQFCKDTHYRHETAELKGGKTGTVPSSQQHWPNEFLDDLPAIASYSLMKAFRYKRRTSAGHSGKDSDEPA
jgi:hypothetical protein